MARTERYVLGALSALSGVIIGLPAALIVEASPPVGLGFGAVVAVLFAGTLYFGFRAALGAEGADS